MSLALFGVPCIRHLGSRIVASDPIDSSQFMWFFAWWPHALLHGLNPFVTHVMFVPEGFNLTWATGMPGPSLLLAPLTLAFGPAVTWNVIQLASPALSAWTAFLLCRHVTRRTAPSLVGGYIFGFSPYMLTHLTGGPYLALVPLLPVFVLLVLRRLEGSIGSAGVRAVDGAGDDRPVSRSPARCWPRRRCSGRSRWRWPSRCCPSGGRRWSTSSSC